MRIYTEINYEWKDGALVQVSSESFEYEGEVAECKGGGTTEATSYTTNIPEWGAGPYKRAISEAERLAYDPQFGYQAYGGPRVAGFSPEEEFGFGARRQMFESGDPYSDFSAGQLESAAAIPGQIGDVSSTYGPASFNFGRFGAQQAQQYMSPYMSAVTEQEKAAAQEEYGRQQQMNAANRVSSGSRGGYRDYVQQAMGGQLHAETMGGIEARGRQSAFENAQQQFERDRGAAIQAAQMGDASALASAKMRMQASQGNRDAEFKKAQTYQDIAKVGSGLGTDAQSRAYERLKEMERSGVTQKEREQQLYDLAYGDFATERDYPKQQLNFLMSMLGGIPKGMEETQYGTTPGLTSQLAGLGALMKAFQGE